jgi:hypothetical protein
MVFVGFVHLYILDSSFYIIFIILMMFYMFIALIEYSVSSKINQDMHTLT